MLKKSILLLTILLSFYSVKAQINLIALDSTWREVKIALSTKANASLSLINHLDSFQVIDTALINQSKVAHQLLINFLKNNSQIEPEYLKQMEQLNEDNVKSILKVLVHLETNPKLRLSHRFNEITNLLIATERRYAASVERYNQLCVSINADNLRYDLPKSNEKIPTISFD